MMRRSEILCLLFISKMLIMEGPAHIYQGQIPWFYYKFGVCGLVQRMCAPHSRTDCTAEQEMFFLWFVLGLGLDAVVVCV